MAKQVKSGQFKYPSRKFGGEVYLFSYLTAKQGLAQDNAADSRKHGLNARVTSRTIRPKKNPGRTTVVYEVWIRPKPAYTHTHQALWKMITDAEKR